MMRAAFLSHTRITCAISLRQQTVLLARQHLRTCAH
jgi:hypothetical protein